MNLEDRKIELGKSSAKCGCKLGPEKQRCICGSCEDNEDEQKAECRSQTVGQMKCHYNSPLWVLRKGLSLKLVISNCLDFLTS